MESSERMESICGGGAVILYEVDTREGYTDL